MPTCWVAVFAWTMLADAPTTAVVVVAVAASVDAAVAVVGSEIVVAVVAVAAASVVVAVAAVDSETVAVGVAVVAAVAASRARRSPFKGLTNLLYDTGEAYLGCTRRCSRALWPHLTKLWAPRALQWALRVVGIEK